MCSPLADLPVIIAFARTADFTLDGRDARLITEATIGALDEAAASGFSLVHAQLLATGGGSPFPPRAALAHMLRGFARWRSARADYRLRLQIHVLNEELLHELASNRLDVVEMSNPDTVRFWGRGNGRWTRPARASV